MTDSLAVQRKLILSLEKVLRSYRLYEARGTQYEAHVNELAGHAALATEVEDVAVNLSPYGPFLEGEQPPSEGEFARQWFTLFEEGARQIVFLNGIDGRQLRELLHILCIEAEDNEDIVTALWRKELTHVQIYVARVLIRSVEGVADGGFSIEEDLGRWKSVLQPGDQPESTTSGDDDQQVRISPDDFRVLVLDDKVFDWCSLSTEPTQEQSEDRKKPRIVQAVDQEISDFERFLDLAANLEGGAEEIILDVINSMTRLGNTDDLNRMICTVAKHEGLQGKSLRRLVEAEGGLESLLPLLESSPTAFQDSLAVFAEVDAEATAAILAQIEQEDVRETLQGFVATAEAAPMHYYALRLLSENQEEAAEAVEVLSQMGSDEAFILALEAYQSVFPAVRRLVMRKLFKRFNPTLAPIVLQALEDTDKSIRVVTLRFIARNGSSNLLRAVINLMRQKDFDKRDFNERIAFVRAIGPHTRLPVINKYLCGLLLEYRIFSSREVIDFLSEVARHLVRSTNPESQSAVKKVLGRWSAPPELKQAIRGEQVRLSEGRTPDSDFGMDEEDDEATMLSDDSVADRDIRATKPVAAAAPEAPPSARTEEPSTQQESASEPDEEEEDFDLDMHVENTATDIPVVDYMAEAMKIIADDEEDE